MQTALLLLAAALGDPQPAGPAAAVPEAVEKMKSAAFLVGQWEGEGWAGSGGQRNPFRIRERVAPRLGGRVLLIEGLGTKKSEGSADGPVVHEVLSFLSWDRASGSYRMRAFKADGTYTDAKADVSENRLVWGFDAPSWGDVRFTITLTDKGQWHEVGEMKRAKAEEWSRFLEMTLNKSEPKASSSADHAEAAEKGASESR